MRTKKMLIGVVLAVVALGVTACGSGATETPEDPGQSSGGDYGLPEGITKLTVGTAVGVAPYEYYEEDGGEVLGYEPDLLNEAASRLGVEIEWVPAEFNSLFSGLSAGRYDLVANGVIDRKSRQENYDLLDYLNDYSGFLGKEGTVDQLETMDDLCGHSVGVLTGSFYADFFTTESERCVTEGLEPIEVTQFNSGPAIVLGVTTDRVDYFPAQIPMLAFAASETPGLEVGGPTYLEGLVALVFEQESELIPPMQKVIDEMIADGTYLEILQKWGMEDLAIEQTVVNAGTVE